MRRIAAASLLIIAGCSTQTSHPPPDPLVVIGDPDRHVETRVDAVQEAWADTEAGTPKRDEVRAQLKDVLWDPESPTLLCLASYRTLMSDTDPAGVEDMHRFIRLRLPTESSLPLVDDMCDTIVERSWRDATPELVRSLARPSEALDDEERPERAALLALHPDRPLDEVAFEVFVDPQVLDGTYAADRRASTRSDAWDLLARLDPDGTARLGWIQAIDAGSDPEIDAIRRCAEDLSTIPLTGEEIAWLARLLETAGRPGAWWDEATASVAALPAEHRAGLRLRHVEPIRWATAHQPGLISSTRDDLLSEMRSRDGAARHHRRIRDQSWDGPVRDRLREWEDQLLWADLLTLIVVDDAIRQAQVAPLLFAQAEADHRDETTEYGGYLQSNAEGRFVAVLSVPRARAGDWRFIASQDMIEASTFALAHYHFHVQDANNVEYAGPSEGDLEYATRHGRTCLVLTGVERDVLGVDVLQPGGVTVDLGEIHR